MQASQLCRETAIRAASIFRPHTDANPEEERKQARSQMLSVLSALEGWQKRVELVASETVRQRARKVTSTAFVLMSSDLDNGRFDQRKLNLMKSEYAFTTAARAELLPDYCRDEPPKVSPTSW